MPLLGFKLFKVKGESMSPLFKNGDILLTKKINHKTKLKLGKIIIADHPQMGTIVKRIAKFEGDKIILKGDGTTSACSFDIAPINRNLITHLVIYKF